jgi:hypothetical protein
MDDSVMALKRECDRCMTQAGNSQAINFQVVQISGHTNERIDLCPSCVTQLRSWLKCTIRSAENA